ncbi:MAG: MFS transporter [Thermomicrobiales bacterium]
MDNQTPTAGRALVAIHEPGGANADQFARSPAKRLRNNRNFNIFWLGQSLSNVGDAVALIAMPLLVLHVTGSVAQMGRVTATVGVAMLIAGVVAGPIADHVDRRRFMILCDLARMVVYAAIPLGWRIAGPQRWLIFFTAGFGAFFGMCFSVTYITAIANLVDRDQVTDANGRLQVSAAVASMIGPALAGVIATRFDPAAALGIDSLSFALSAGSLACIRLRKAEAPRSDGPPIGRIGELLAGVRFLWQQPVLRALTWMIAGFSFLTMGGLDLFIFHLKHDLGQSDRAVGLVFGVASSGAIVGGLLAAPARRRWGFAVCYLGSAIVEGVILAAIGLAPTVAFMLLLAVGFLFLEILKGVNSIAVRQQVTPDHLLGRVTAAFWTINSAPGPIGAALFTALAASIGAPIVLLLIGAGFTAIALLGLRTPARARYPERVATPSENGC